MAQLVRRGDRGPRVRELQGNLRLNGETVRVDGVFGPDTDRAVRAFQTSRRLKVDGIAGPTTMNALLRVSPTTRTGVDLFDPSDLSRWLTSLRDAASDWLGGADEATPTRSVPPRATAPLHGGTRPSAPTPSAAARRTGPPLVSPDQNRKFSRLRFEGYEGQGWVLRDFERFRGMQVQLLPTKVVREYAATPPLRNECAQFVQLFGVPNTRSWRRGPQVCHMARGDLPVGTVVATLRDGRYHNDYSGRSHVGIYLGHDDYAGYQSANPNAGVKLLDQWNGAKIDARVKRYAVEADAPGRKARRAWVDAAGVSHSHRVNWGGDGEEYFVLMSA